MPRSEKLAQKFFFYFAVLGFKAETFSLNLTKHVRLNSLSHDIYLRVVYQKLFKISFLLIRLI